MQIAFRVKLIWNNFTQSANSHPISFPPSCVWIYADFPLDDQTWLSNHGIILIVGKVTSRPNLWAWLVQSVQQTILLLAPLQHNTRRMLVLPNSNEVCVEFGGEIWIFQKRSAWKTAKSSLFKCCSKPIILKSLIFCFVLNARKCEDKAWILQQWNSQICETEHKTCHTLTSNQDLSTATYDWIRMDSNRSKFSPASFQLHIGKLPCLCLWVPCLHLYTVAVAI